MGIVAYFYRTQAAKTEFKAKILPSACNFSQYLFFSYAGNCGCKDENFWRAGLISEANQTKENEHNWSRALHLFKVYLLAYSIMSNNSIAVPTVSHVFRSAFLHASEDICAKCTTLMELAFSSENRLKTHRLYHSLFANGFGKNDNSSLEKPAKNYLGLVHRGFRSP